MKLSFRSRFLLKNVLKGLLGLGLILIAYMIVQRLAGFDAFMDSIGHFPVLVYSVYTISEVIFGIIPPELFMIWSFKNGVFDTYILNVALLASISYAAGVFGYFIGGFLQKKKPVFFNQYILRYKNTLNRFGGFLIVIGAITPIPFSAVCMLMGATKYNLRKFLIVALSRFLRFAVYGFTIYQFHI